MALIQQCLTTSFKQGLLLGLHNFSATGGNTFKIALYESSATLNASTTAYTATGEVVADGYTAGGETLTNVEPSSSGLVAWASFAPVSWTAEITARGALIYDTTAPGTPSVMVIDFGMDRSSVSGVFTITFPTANAQTAIIRLAQ